MKKTLIIRSLFFLFILSNAGKSSAQSTDAYLREQYFGRLQNARAEAMGRAFTAVEDGLNSVYHNPAGLAKLRGIEILGSNTPDNYYLYKKPDYQMYAAGFRLNKNFQFALSRSSFKGDSVVIGNDFYRYFSEKNTISISSNHFKNLKIGINLNYIRQHFTKVIKYSAYSADIGAIKTFNLFKFEKFEHSATAGAAVTNFNYPTSRAEMKGYTDKSKLPVIARIGASYQIALKKHFCKDSLEYIRILAQGEYQNLLNSQYLTARRGGLELCLFDHLLIRGGYYTENQNTYGQSVNYSRIHAYTYGMGLQIPLYKYSKLPLNIRFDYCELPQVKYSSLPNNFNAFQTYNLKIVWLLHVCKKSP